MPPAGLRTQGDLLTQPLHADQQIDPHEADSSGTTIFSKTALQSIGCSAPPPPTSHTAGAQSAPPEPGLSSRAISKDRIFGLDEI
ncbi:uncharacterized protein N7482_000233 [Penicillium canariense]|uniref:Uncharacterized protein n=1 Tax=Penicillium canariense TaxID=189055 RepID=A0A9W9IHG8_9EURO|nr:uncharacterized protein N7482_000233 [Penicillium canariense]KAJ5174356.1 hypothetical protein N7482_000233 [Penicillium canariense]